MHPSAEVRETMVAFYRHMLAGESDAANELISREAGTLLIGSAGEWVDDQEQLRGTYQVDTEGLIASENPVAYEHGDMGWYADRPIWHFADGTEAEMRVSAVLQREPGGWRVVHSHLSVGVPDDQCVMLQRRWKYGIPASD